MHVRTVIHGRWRVLLFDFKLTYLLTFVVYYVLQGYVALLIEYAY